MHPYTYSGLAAENASDVIADYIRFAPTNSRAHYAATLIFWQASDTEPDDLNEMNAERGRWMIDRLNELSSTKADMAVLVSAVWREALDA